MVSVFVHSKILFPFVQNTVWPDRPAALFLILEKKMPEALLKLLIVLAFSLITLSLHNAGRVVIENLPMSRRERLLIAIPAVLGFLLFSSLTFSENYTTTLPDFFIIKDRQEEGLVYLAAALGIIAGLITLEFRK